MSDVKLNAEGRRFENRIRSALKEAKAKQKEYRRLLSQDPLIFGRDVTFDRLILAQHRENNLSRILGELLTGWYQEFVEKNNDL